MRGLYSLAVYLITPVILLHLLWRGIRSAAYLKRWPERFAFYRQPAPRGGIVVHAVSVGETNAASPLVRALREAYPNLPVTLTNFTPTGAERVVHLFQDQVFQVYAPLDLPGAVQRFFDHLQPKLLVIMETEIWPNLYQTAHDRQIPIIIANARLSEKSLKGYRWLKPLTRRVLKNVAVAAQGDTDAQRLAACGAETAYIEVVGNLKFDIRVDASLNEQGELIRQKWGPQRLVILAASTHEGDDETIFSAFVSILKKHSDTLLVIVPRHPERFGRVAQMAKALGLNTALRSETEVCDSSTQCFVIDSMGELLRYCAAANIAIVGGSFEAIGGHNVLEPAALAKPVVVGPHMFNFEEITGLMLANQAAVQVDSSEGLITELLRLMENPGLRDDMGLAGLRLVEQGRGALARTLKMVKAALPDI